LIRFVGTGVHPPFHADGFTNAASRVIVVTLYNPALRRSVVELNDEPTWCTFDASMNVRAQNTKAMPTTIESRDLADVRHDISRWN